MTRDTLGGGRAAGTVTGLGVASGLLLWTAVSVLGTLAPLKLSILAHTLLRVFGSA